MIEEYRRANKSPNLFQAYITRAIAETDLGWKLMSVFVFGESINITLSPNKTHSFKVPEKLNIQIARYYSEQDANAMDFTLDFSDNTIMMNE
jgi:hypothetical protein